VSSFASRQAQKGAHDFHQVRLSVVVAARTSSGAIGDMGAVPTHIMSFDVMPLDHSIESLSIDCEDARCRLLVPTGVLQHARNVATFDL